MAYILTDEQKAIVTTAKALYEQDSPELLKIEAVAGASKTFTSIQIAEAVNGTAGVYLAYTKRVADEAQGNFPDWVECKTTHSNAYYPVITLGLDEDGQKGTARKVTGYLSYKDINYPKAVYEDKIECIKTLERFFVSPCTATEDFFKSIDGEDTAKLVQEMVEYYFRRMINKQMDVTHGFYLKFYHILLATDCVHYDAPFDLIILDEAGDINGVTLEIFKLLPAKLKVIVGDSLQNIFGFNHTINGFEALKQIGTTKYLSQSFRCSIEIANDVEWFLREYVDESTIFRGTEHKDKTIRTHAVVSRTNTELISHMIQLGIEGKEYNLTRPVKEIFEVVLILATLKPDSKIYNSRYKDLVKDAARYAGSTSLQLQYRTLLVYLRVLYAEEDRSILTAINVIFRYGKKLIWDTYNEALAHEKDRKVHDITLTTAHSGKGATYDSVELGNDFNLDDIIDKGITCKEDKEELLLYYVACTRARLRLTNTKYL